MADPITKSLIILVKYFNDNKIPYVIVGGVAVLVFGRTRVTMDIDIIIDHKLLDRPDFISYLRNNGFDANMSDLLAFDEGLHAPMFLKDGMFRIDMKGCYSGKEKESIAMAVLEDYNGIEIAVDHPQSIIIHKLLFGSQQDYEDALAVYIRNEEIIDHDWLRKKAEYYGITGLYDEFIQEVKNFLSKQQK